MVTLNVFSRLSKSPSVRFREERGTSGQKDSLLTNVTHSLSKAKDKSGDRLHLVIRALCRIFRGGGGGGGGAASC